MGIFLVTIVVVVIVIRSVRLVLVSVVVYFGVFIPRREELLLRNLRVVFVRLSLALLFVLCNDALSIWRRRSHDLVVSAWLLEELW
jgi:hypothetical protein